MRFGYFIPKQDLLCGDEEYARQSREIYDSFGLPKSCDHSDCKLKEACPGRYYKDANHYDGVSIFTRDDGTTVKRVAMRNLFSVDFKVYVQDL